MASLKTFLWVLTAFLLAFILLRCCRIWCARRRASRMVTFTNVFHTDSTVTTTVSGPVLVVSTTTTTTAATAPPAANSPSGGDRGLSPVVIASLPEFFYSYSAQEEKLECAVCLAECKNKERGRLLPGCGHSFHAACIDEWLRTHTTCPVCRSDLASEHPELPV